MEKINLKRLNPLKIVEYIKSIIEILINYKVEEKFALEKKKLIESESSFSSSVNELIVNNSHVKSCSSYEKIIRELEAALRAKIKSEQFLQLQLENFQKKYSYLEKKYEELEQHSENSLKNSYTPRIKPSNMHSHNRSLTPREKSRDFDKNDRIRHDKNKTPTRINRKYFQYGELSPMINPINYNFNNPIVIYGDNKTIETKKTEEQDTVNVS